MTPRPKKYPSTSERTKAYQKRLQAAGKRRVCVWLEEERANALKDLAKKEGISMAELIDQWIVSATEVEG